MAWHPKWLVFLFTFVLACGAYATDFNGTHRLKRTTCLYGDYVNGGKSCCRCAAGQYVKQHCSANSDDGICEPCRPGTFRHEPDFQENCEPCTSCHHPFANLEEDQVCTAVSNTVCRCKPHHFCVEATEPCTRCQPCKDCGDDGVKVQCSNVSDAVCNEKSEGGSKVGLGVGLSFGLLAALACVGVGLFLWRREKCRKSYKPTELEDIGRASDPEMQPLSDSAPIVDLSVLRHDIVKILGWKDIKEVAERSNMMHSVIEDAQSNHPGDRSEAALELLDAWVEIKGRTASKDLVDMLRKCNKNNKADQVLEKLNSVSDGSATQTPP